MPWIGLAMLMFLTSCETASSSIARSCPVPRDYSKETEAQAQVEFDALPKDSTLRDFMKDYKVLRKESVDCWTK